MRHVDGLAVLGLFVMTIALGLAVLVYGLAVAL